MLNGITAIHGTPPPPLTVTGGTLYTSGGYNYRVFTGNGTLGISGGSLTCDYLVIGAGGGSGGYRGGGGGAGGYKAVGTAGTANTGGGAGGGARDEDVGTPYAGATGGSGVVIVRYAV